MAQHSASPKNPFFRSVQSSPFFFFLSWYHFVASIQSWGTQERQACLTNQYVPASYRHGRSCVSNLFKCEPWAFPDSFRSPRTTADSSGLGSFWSPTHHILTMSRRSIHTLSVRVSSHPSICTCGVRQRNIILRRSGMADILSMLENRVTDTDNIFQDGIRIAIFVASPFSLLSAPS